MRLRSIARIKELVRDTGLVSDTVKRMESPGKDPLPVTAAVITAAKAEAAAHGRDLPSAAERRISDYIDKLPSNDRAILRMYQADGTSPTEIATAMGLEWHVVMECLVRIYSDLRKIDT